MSTNRHTSLNQITLKMAIPLRKAFHVNGYFYSANNTAVSAISVLHGCTACTDMRRFHVHDVWVKKKEGLSETLANVSFPKLQHRIVQPFKPMLSLMLCRPEPM
jgi:hypothetical protein